MSYSSEYPLSTVEYVPSEVCPQIFAPTQFYKTDNIDEAIEVKHVRFTFEATPVSVDQIFVEPDTKVRLRSISTSFRMTDSAFDTLCEALGFPPNFAHSIPYDLSSMIIDGLKPLHQQQLVAIHDHDRIIRFVNPLKGSRSQTQKQRPHYQPPPILELFKLCKKLWNPDDQVRIALSDTGCQCEVTDPQVTIEPEVDDITQVGLVITASETGGPLPQARGYTLRLKCTNGATVPSNFGMARFSADWRMRMDRRLQIFEDQVRGLAMQMDGLREIYARLVSQPVLDQLFYDVYRQTQYAYRNHAERAERVDHTLGVEPDTRREIIGLVRDRQRNLRNDLRTMAHIIPPHPQPTAIRGFDLFNSLTATAREERNLPRRIALEQIAGDVMAAYATVEN